MLALDEEFEVSIRSVVDVPFPKGTLAVNSAEPDAFSERDIAFIQELTDTVADGLLRLEILRQLENPNDAD